MRFDGLFGREAPSGARGLEQHGWAEARPASKRVDHDEGRTEIAEALLRVAGRRGLHAVGKRDVADEAGVSLRLVQYCFETKEKLGICCPPRHGRCSGSPSVWTTRPGGAAGGGRCRRR